MGSGGSAKQPPRATSGHCAEGRCATSHTGFPAVSPAKTFTAAAALRLVQEAWSWMTASTSTSPISRSPTPFPGRLITLRHLLTRTDPASRTGPATAAADVAVPDRQQSRRPMLVRT
ncbi:serine hydrolase [Microbispora hainanensis]|uniref:Serine hydrolase n=1 Tax=Microbispora hainanensis TaxID=568844 RepID=A0A544YMI2_9ACTN|nr:serine hydrolase [Microbispora hainanensis]